MAGDLADFDDPWDAELAGAALLSLGGEAEEPFDQMLIDGLIQGFEARADGGALAMLLVIGAVGPGRAGRAASAAAERLTDAGIGRPGWAAALEEPVSIGDCVRLHDAAGIGSVLACTIRRGGCSHAVQVGVDERGCGAATEIVVLEASQLPQRLGQMRAAGGEDGLEIVTEPLERADFRWRVENALAARAFHDAQWPGGVPLTEDEADADYPVLAALLRAWLAVLPVPDRPPAVHGCREQPGAILGDLLQLLDATPAWAPPPLPEKRHITNRPASVYQIKVWLRATKPPIWRRLQVPADISLDRLHEVIRVAFDRPGEHLHVFSTPYGEFGDDDPDLGHQAEAPVTLEQVAPTPTSKITYTYDFGDDWQHDILVEKVIEPVPATAYPRCTGGRRAAPPDDCGGMGGYYELLDVLADPAHPEHEDQLDWLGLADAADFDPARFDADEINRHLARRR